MQPHDHEQIHDEDVMLRGIPIQWIKSTDGGERRISSGALQPSSEARGGGLSLGAKKVLECVGRSVDDWASGRFAAVVCLEAREFRSNGLQVGWNPLDGDQAHCDAWGTLTKGIKRRLAQEARRRFLDS